MKLTKLLRALSILALILALQAAGFAQGVTTSSMQGVVSDENSEPLIGANVVAVHIPSGTFYGTSTDIEGNYRIPNMRVGGPYKVSVSYTGFGEKSIEGIFLRLGEKQTQNFPLSETALDLIEVTVVGRTGNTGQNAGASTQISEEDITAMPTLDRNLEDFTRLTPQVESASGGGISIAGVNNRYNAIYIDGAVNNDVFGLADNGQNGGQTGISPISIDVIDQIQVVISPYDVTLGGFAGGGINAVTKSGTNNFEGTAYYFMQNENLAGKTPGQLADRIDLADDDRTRLAEFNERLYGASLGGPIVKDKVFFFANVEIQDDETPVPFNFEEYNGDASLSDLEGLRTTLRDEYGYDPGGFLGKTDRLEGLKFFGKLDFNLSNKHRLTIRHQYTKAEQTNVFGSSSNTINYTNNGVFFPSTTNSSALELNSRFSNTVSNNLIIGYTSVLDDRDPIGGNFPYLFIEDGDGLIRIGSEEFSTGNQLDQKIFTITDNLKLYKGNHTITLGTHNEFYDIYNLFIRQNFGSYRFSSLQSFLDGEEPTEYNRSYSLVDDVTGDGSAAAADFNAMQLGFYVQDEWLVSPKLTLTGGLRVDVPIITSDPEEDTYFNNTALPAISDFYDTGGARAGQAPDGQLMFSPRLGFSYDANVKTVVRGGLGVFTSRIPFVWPGAMFNNNGLTIGGLDESDLNNVTFIPEFDKQPTNPDFSVPSGQMDLFVQDFKYPQVFRTNLAVDHELPGGIQATLEGIYTKTLNNIIYTNINSDPTVDFRWPGNDNRPIFVGQDIDPTYLAVYLADNTSDGYTYNFTASFSKNFDFGLSAFLAYTYGGAEAVNEGTSSQNSSQWRGQVHVDGRNFPVLGRSDFSLGSRFVSALSYKIDWLGDNLGTSISLFYNGQSGRPYSYVYDVDNIPNEEGSVSRERTLIYIPASASDINLVDADGMTAAQQWDMLNTFIEQDDYLSENRGGYAEKNSNRTPFEGVFDLRLLQDLRLKTGSKTNTLQLSIDIFNFANLLSKDWGVSYDRFLDDQNNLGLIEFEGYEADGVTPTFSYTRDEVGDDIYDIRSFNSRWRAQFGIRYIFK